MPLHAALSDLMDAIDRESEFDDYGYFIDPETDETHFLWDMQADECAWPPPGPAGLLEPARRVLRPPVVRRERDRDRRIAGQAGEQILNR